MKQKILKIVGFFAVAFLVTTQVASAGIIDDIKARLNARKEVRGDLKEIRKESGIATTSRVQERKEVRNELKDIRKENVLKTVERRAEHRYEVMNKRITATIERLERIMGSLNSRIAKIKAAGGNTDTAEKYVTEAKTRIDKAKSMLATLNTAVTEAVNTETASSTPSVSRSSLVKLRNAAKAIQAELVAARVSLSKAIGSLKGAPQPNATSTNSQ
jgi:DNA repair ATPase RecN